MIAAPVFSHKIKPNFFIVGAPKCGTSSLFQYLSTHPDVFVPSNKEPHYFAKDLKWRRDWGVRDIRQYMALFTHADCYKRIGEGSTWYLYSKEAAGQIKVFNNDAKIIAMLRRPWEMMYSMHGHNLRFGTEDIVDFEEALRAEDDRREGRRIPSSAPFPDILFYKACATYSVQLERYYEQFGRENVQVILFDDFVRDTPAAYRKVLRFLDLDDVLPAEFEVFNAAAPLRNLEVKRFARRYPQTTRLLMVLLPSSVRSAIKLAQHWLIAPPQRAPLSEAIRLQLSDRFSDEVDRLARLTGRDLAAEWTD